MNASETMRGGKRKREVGFHLFPRPSRLIDLIGSSITKKPGK